MKKYVRSLHKKESLAEVEKAIEDFFGEAIIREVRKILETHTEAANEVADEMIRIIANYQPEYALLNHYQRLMMSFL